MAVVERTHDNSPPFFRPTLHVHAGNPIGWAGATDVRAACAHHGLRASLKLDYDVETNWSTCRHDGKVKERTRRVIALSKRDVNTELARSSPSGS